MSRVLFLDDSELAVPTFSSVCTFCQHWNRKSGRTCKAFPKGVPMEIWLGENDHRTPFKGDHGIQFEEVDVTDYPVGIMYEAEEEMYECPKCGEEIMYAEDGSLPEKCPGCGAKMARGEEEEAE